MDPSPVPNNVCFAPKATGLELKNACQLSATFGKGARCIIVVRGIYFSGLQRCQMAHNLLHYHVF
jgi:hypothetical protein